MKTYTLTAKEIDKRWRVFDAADQPLGRVATQIAIALRGKDKPTFTPSLDMGDFVIVTNAAVLPALGFPRPRPPSGAAASSSAVGGGAVPAGDWLRSAPYAIKTFSASTSEATAARKNGVLLKRSPFGIDVEWNWPANVLFGSAPRSRRIFMRSTAVNLFG